jgi:hypothetical protein
MFIRRNRHVVLRPAVIVRPIFNGRRGAGDLRRQQAARHQGLDAPIPRTPIRHGVVRDRL